MPWYKIEFHSGPGHQSKHEEYDFMHETLTPEEEKDLFEQHSWTYDDAIGKVSIVDKIPAKVKEKLIRDYAAEHRHATEMLGILQVTSTT